MIYLVVFFEVFFDNYFIHRRLLKIAMDWFVKLLLNKKLYNTSINLPIIWFHYLKFPLKGPIVS